MEDIVIHIKRKLNNGYYLYVFNPVGNPVGNAECPLSSHVIWTNIFGCTPHLPSLSLVEIDDSRNVTLEWCIRCSLGVYSKSIRSLKVNWQWVCAAEELPLKNYINLEYTSRIRTWRKNPEVDFCGKISRFWSRSDFRRTIIMKDWRLPFSKIDPVIFIMEYKFNKTAHIHVDNFACLPYQKDRRWNEFQIE